MLGLLSDGAGEQAQGTGLPGVVCSHTAQPGSATHREGPFRLMMLHV